MANQAALMDVETEQVEHAEAIIFGDDRLVKTLLKMRTKLAEMSKEYDAAVDCIKAQKHAVEMELLKRLTARGATQTKTSFGTAFIGEDLKVTIADELLFQNFVKEEGDLDFYQKRVAVGHLQEWQKLNAGRLPPGLSTFREATITVRSPTKSKGTTS